MWTVDRLGQWRNAQYGTAPAMAWPTPKAPQQSAQAVAPNRRATEGPAQLRPATAVSAATTLVVCKSTGYGSSRQRSTSLGTAANAAPNANSSNGSGANVPVQRKPLCPLNTSQIVVAAPTGPVKDAAFEKIVPVVKPAAPAVIKAVVPPPPPQQQQQPQQQQPQQQAPVIPVAQPTSTTTAAASAAPVVAQPQQPMSQQTTRHQSPVTTPAATAACSAPPAPAVSSAPVTVTVPVPAVPLPTATPAPKMVPTDAAISSSTRRASISSAPTPPALPKTLTRSRPSPNPPAAYTPCTMKQWGSLNRAIYRKKCGAIAAAVAHVTGMRESNEDTHVLEHSRRDATAAGGAAWHSVFGVFDGHGGAQCSKFLADTLPAAIRKASPPLADGQLTSLALQLDEEYLNHNPTGGSTAAFAVVTPAPCAAYDVQLCHVGNARAVLIRRGRILHETRDHTPLVQEERERIEKAGGTVVDARLDGRLENSRAFGDAAWKVDASGKRPDPSDTVAVQTARLVAVPTVTRLLCEEGDVLVVACDGLFETADTDAACQRIYQGLLQNKELGTLAAECCEQAVWSGSEDNVTVMLVQFGGPANLGIAEREFVPGPFHPRTKDFCAAYREDVTNAGWTIGKALAKRCQFLRRHEQQCQEKGQAMSSVLQFELKSWLCNGPSLPLDGQEAWNWFEQLAAHWEKQLDASANRH